MLIVMYVLRFNVKVFLCCECLEVFLTCHEEADTCDSSCGAKVRYLKQINVLYCVSDHFLTHRVENAT